MIALLSHPKCCSFQNQKHFAPISKFIFGTKFNKSIKKSERRKEKKNILKKNPIRLTLNETHKFSYYFINYLKGNG